MTQNILLTGGTGLIGSSLVNALVTSNCNVTALYRKNKQEISDVKWLHCDLLNFDPSTLNPIKDVNILIHNAACVAIGSTKEEVEQIKRINFDATSKLFDWAVGKGVKKIIFTGSLSVLKKPLQHCITEQDETNPQHYYAESKLFAENKLLVMNREYGMTNIILRISSPIPSYYRQMHETVVKKWIDLSIAGENIDVYGSGERTQDIVSVTDIARSFVSSIKKDSAAGIFNIASGTPISMNTIATLITQKYNNKINYQGADKDDTDRWNISIRKASEILNFEPEHSSEANIRALLASIG